MWSSSVSHELRTPVSILAGYIENSGRFPEMARTEQAEIFAIMQEHVTRLKALLDDLLTLAAFESKSEVLDYSGAGLCPSFCVGSQRTGSRRSQAGEMGLVLRTR